MIDFKKLVKKKRTVDITDLEKLFEALDRQTSHTDLRPVQREALHTITTRRNERDLVLKISTGAGKTTVALLYLQSHMEEKEQPVVYLCPTTQLVDQVQKEAMKLGINAVVYPKGEPHPHVDGTAAKAVIICTYDKLFNAKSTFDRSDVHLRPCAIVLDDAHAGVEEIRDAFTLSIRSGNLLEGLLKILQGPCEQYKPGLWQEILKQDPVASLEVPYWIWQPLVVDIQKLLSSHSEDSNLIFVWPFLRDMLRWCRCVISGSGIEIVPDILPVNKIPAFSEAKHRLFMSATLADDSVLVREFGCNISATRNPILPAADRGLGERMVLAPALVHTDLNRAWVMEICKQLSKRYRVVVLSSSKETARDWVQFGAKVVLGDDVSAAVENLKEPSSDLRFVVFVQRYDGVDLPDNACRILVIDGMPYGEGIVDKYDSSIASIAGGVRNRLIYRIEQGMGRSIRSHVDYAVVILVGPDLAHFIAKHDVLKAMNPDTKAQLKLALDLAKLAMEGAEDDPSKTLVNMLLQCLRRDDGWKQFYDENVRKAEKMSVGGTDETRLTMAEAERKSFDLAMGNAPLEAADNLRQALNKSHLTDKEKAWYLQRVANYMFEANPGEALQVQRAAYEKNNSMFCPPGVVLRPVTNSKFDSQAIILEWFKEFENPNGTIAAIQDLRARLSYNGSPEAFEQAVLDLAQLVGARSFRPEKEFGEGPDDLWLWPSVSLVIEAKNENKKTLHKKDAGQLLLSLQWFKRSYPLLPDPIAVVAAKVSIADRNAGFPDGTRVLSPEKMQELMDKIEAFFQLIVSRAPLKLELRDIAEMQTQFGLTAEQFIKRYTVPLKELR